MSARRTMYPARSGASTALQMSVTALPSCTACRPAGAAGGNRSTGVAQAGAEGGPSTVTGPVTINAATAKHCARPKTTGAENVVAVTGAGVAIVGAGSAGPVACQTLKDWPAAAGFHESVTCVAS